MPDSLHSVVVQGVLTDPRTAGGIAGESGTGTGPHEGGRADDPAARTATAAGRLRRSAGAAARGTAAAPGPAADSAAAGHPAPG
ncbi:hypothetical protein EAO73_35320, partial [Streptomyces sp. col6]